MDICDGVLCAIIILIIWVVSASCLYPINKSCKAYINKPHEHIDRIIDNIFLGNWGDSISEDSLKYNNIKCILTLNKNFVHSKTDRDMFDRLGIKYKYIEVQDSVNANILQHVDTSLQFLKQCSGNILVHCTAGVSRSVSIVIAYLMKEKNMTYDDALSFIKKKRPIANPNKSFIYQLKYHSLRIS